MADEQVTIPGNADKAAAVQAELMKAVQFAAEDTAQTVELAEAMFDMFPPADENAPLIAKMVACRLMNAAMLVMRSVKGTPAAGQGEAVSHG